jgi:hypothetical protein
VSQIKILSIFFRTSFHGYEIRSTAEITDDVVAFFNHGFLGIHGFLWGGNGYGLFFLANPLVIGWPLEQGETGFG